MVQAIDNRLKGGRFHWPLFWVTVALSVIGLLTLYSATFVLGSDTHSPLFTTQLISFGVGYGALFVFSLIDYRLLERMALFFYGSSIVLLLLVLFIGKTIAGHTSWIALGSFAFQPSEFAKLGLILAMAYFFSRTSRLEAYSIGNLLIPLLILLAPVSLVLLEKDLGTTLFIILLFSSYLFFVGIKKRTVLIFVMIALAGSWFGYAKFLSPHQKARIQTFLNPTTDPKGEGYQTIQAKIAVGSGKIWGRGYLKGMHNKLLYLPEKHSDFIFPVLAEEWGVLGSTTLLSLYFMWIYFSFSIAARAKDRFGIFLAYGLASLFFWQTLINMGGVLGVIPLTGVTLPLLSYGGSSVVTLLASTGIVLSIWRRRFMF